MVIRQVTAMVYTVQWVYIARYETMCIKNNMEFNDVNSSKCVIKILMSKTCYMILYYLHVIVTEGFATVIIIKVIRNHVRILA